MSRRSAPLHGPFLECSQRRLSRFLLLVLLVITGTGLPGCRQTQTFESVSLPARHSVRSGKLLVMSDYRVSRDHPMLAELEYMRELVVNSLELPAQRDEVIIYLFDNPEHYRHYLELTYPGLPDRRAYFVGSASELTVYTHWGSRVMEDLRHEYTHGILHSCLSHVPLWLDEGLAEYFEVGGDNPGGINGDHAVSLTASLAGGWKPDLKRLESLTDFSKMQKIDYQESWVWTHYLLHSSPETRQILVDYLAALREKQEPQPISERLNSMSVDHSTRFIAHLASLQINRTMPLHAERSSLPDARN